MVVLKPNLQDKEKKVLMIVIPLQVVANIAQVANKFGLKFFFSFSFWLGHELGPIPKRGPAGAGSSPKKKLGTLNRPSLGHGSGYEKTQSEPDPLSFLVSTK